MSGNWSCWRRLWYPYPKRLSLRSMRLGETIAIWLSPRQLPYSSFRQVDERDDSGKQQEVTTVAEDHRDPENPDHSRSLVCCRVMSSYRQVWNPWRVRGGSVTMFFLSFFVSSNVSSHYAVSSFVGLIHASSIVSPYVLSFGLYIVSSLFYYRFIHRFDYLCVWTCSIYSRELYCSLASL